MHLHSCSHNIFSRFSPAPLLCTIRSVLPAVGLVKSSVRHRRLGIGSETPSALTTGNRLLLTLDVPWTPLACMEPAQEHPVTRAVFENKLVVVVAICHVCFLQFPLQIPDLFYKTLLCWRALCHVLKWKGVECRVHLKSTCIWCKDNA